MSGEWQTINDDTPKDRTILVSDGVAVASAEWDYGQWLAAHAFSEPLTFNPVYWRDCPAPPAVSEFK